MLRSVLAAAMLLASVSVVWSAGVSNQVLYQIDVNADPGDNGEVSASSTTPGQLISIVHPQGKGDASGMADYGLLRARARLDPDFPTDQTSVAYAQTTFDDVLTISGSNNGAIASARFALRVIGTIRQPFYVSEVTGYASAGASLFAGSDLESNSDNGSYDAQGPEPIFVSYDDMLVVTVQFTVGQPINVYGSLDASSAANLNVAPDADHFLADFLNGAVFQPIELIGVNDPVISADSGHHYLRQFPQGSSGDVTGLIVGKATGSLTLSWNPSCIATDTDYEIYQGSIGAWTSHVPNACTTGGATTTSVVPPVTNTYYLVVPTNGSREGSYGRRTAGQRPPSAAGCAAQQFAGCP